MWLYLKPNGEIVGLVSDEWLYRFGGTDTFRVDLGDEIDIWAMIARFTPIGEYQLPLF